MGKKGSGGDSRSREKPRSTESPRSIESPRSTESIRFPFPSGELLRKGLASLGLPSSGERYLPVHIRPLDETINLLERYMRELELFNAAFDLVGAETGSEQGRADLVVRHILDSLAPWQEIAAELSARVTARLEAAEGTAERASVAELADAGSGAGFPGIPLAILFPDARVTLIERMSKRCAFLENCKAMLALQNVTVLNAEVENAPSGAYDVVAFRAFRPLDRAMVTTLLALTRKQETASRPLGSRAAPDRTGGCLAAWKARRERIEAEMGAIAEDVGYWEAKTLTVPFLEHEERNLVLIER